MSPRMLLSGLIDEWFRSFRYGGARVWHKELQVLHRNFPFLGKYSSAEMAEVDLKQRYDNLYTEVYRDQEQSFTFLLSSISRVMEDIQVEVCQEMEAKKLVFVQASLLKRKKLLLEWNYKVIQNYVAELKRSEVERLEFEADNFEQVEFGEIEVSEVGDDAVKLQARELKIESITFCGLTEFPEQAVEFIKQNLPELKSIEIQQCRFIDLPVDFGSLERLEELSIRRTPLLRLPASFAWLRNLKTLHIFDADLTEFPHVLAIMPALQDINIAKTRISIIEATPLVNRFLQKLGLDPEDILAKQKAVANDAANNLPNYWQGRLGSNIVNISHYPLRR